MPRELINARVVGSYQTHVGWLRDGELVQVGVGVDGGKSLFWQLLGTNTERIGRELKRLLGNVATFDEVKTSDQDATQNQTLGEAIINLLDVSVGPEPRTETCNCQETPCEHDLPGSDTDVSQPWAHSGYDSVWADLTRADVNEMIRVLRRARDQAFGRDE